MTSGSKSYSGEEVKHDEFPANGKDYNQVYKIDFDSLLPRSHSSKSQNDSDYKIEINDMFTMEEQPAAKPNSGTNTVTQKVDEIVNQVAPKVSQSQFEKGIIQ